MSDEEEVKRLDSALKREQQSNGRLNAEVWRLEAEVKEFRRNAPFQGEVDHCRDVLHSCLLRAVDEIDQGLTEDPMPGDWYFKAKHYIQRLKEAKQRMQEVAREQT